MLENGNRDNVELVHLYELRVRRWRDMVWWTLLLLLAWAAVETCLAWGVVPHLFGGFEPRNTAEAVDSNLRKDTVEIRTRLLEQSLLSTRQGECMASQKSYFTERLDELTREYHSLTGQAWRVPDCSEVTQ